MTATKRKAIRSRKNGQLFPVNEELMRHDDTELVYIDENGKVIEPEEVGPAAAMELPELGEKEAEEEKEEEEEKGGEKAGAEDTATAAVRRTRRSNK